MELSVVVHEAEAVDGAVVEHQSGVEYTEVADDAARAIGINQVAIAGQDR